MNWKILFLLAVFSQAAASVLSPGYRPARLTEGVKDALQFAVKEHNRQTKDVFLKVINAAERKVCNFRMYYFDVNFAMSGGRLIYILGDGVRYVNKITPVLFSVGKTNMDVNRNRYSNNTQHV